MGWLDASIRPAKSPKQKKAQQDESPPTTRREKLLADGVDLPLLDPGPAAYLLDYFMDLGPVHLTAMGGLPIGYEQIDAWARVTGIRLSPWEATTLRNLSCAYAAEKSTASDPHAAAPGGLFESAEQASERRERVSNGLAQMLRSFKRGPNT